MSTVPAKVLRALKMESWAGPWASFVPIARPPSGLRTFVVTLRSPMKIVAVPPAIAFTWSTMSVLPLIRTLPK